MHRAIAICLIVLALLSSACTGVAVVDGDQAMPEPIDPGSDLSEAANDLVAGVEAISEAGGGTVPSYAALAEPYTIEIDGATALSFAGEGFTEVLFAGVKGSEFPAAFAVAIDDETRGSAWLSYVVASWWGDETLRRAVPYAFTDDPKLAPGVRAGEFAEAEFHDVTRFGRGFERVLTITRPEAEVDSEALVAAVLDVAARRAEVGAMTSAADGQLANTVIPVDAGPVNLGMTQREFMAAVEHTAMVESNRFDRVTFARSVRADGIDFILYYFAKPSGRLYEVDIVYTSASDAFDRLSSWYGDEPLADSDWQVQEVRQQATELVFASTGGAHWIVPLPSGHQAWIELNGDRLEIVSTMPGTEFGFND